MNDFVSTTDRSATIRAELKKRGISSRHVSVRTDYYSMGSSIYVTIKDAAVSSELVKAIAKQHESIDRDQFGEILNGCNRYVHVSYSDSARQALAAPYLDAVKAAFAKIPHGDDRTLVSVEGTDGAMVSLYQGHLPTLWADGRFQHCGSEFEIAVSLGMMKINRTESHVA